MRYQVGQKVIVHNNGEGLIRHYLIIGSEAKIERHVRDDVYEVVGTRTWNGGNRTSLQRVKAESIRPINYETNCGAKYLLEDDY